MITGRGEDNRRLFFALWPGAHTTEQLADLQRDLHLAGRPVSPGNLHITLIFIGSVDAQCARCLHSAAGAVIFPQFSLSLDSLGYFSRPKVCWVGPGRMPPALNSLRRDLLRQLQTCGYGSDTRSSPAHFSPHVSLARKSAPLEARPFASIPWRVKDFALVESRSTSAGVEYHLLERYPALEAARGR